MTAEGPGILVAGVDKAFRIPEEQVHTLKERVLHPVRRPAHHQFSALQGVSFDVAKGEFFGIVGRNGSGKSTLLKCMAGIYGVDAGRIFVDGRVSTFIELGVGFNLDLPARDNILINATMLGLSQREARQRIDAVLDFAELREFVDLKLKNYSSGMLVRLAFSVMIQVDADILLIDEVLAVGDAAFQQKCFDEFARLRRENRTVVLVTHDMGSIERFCDRAMLLERGRVVEIGEPQPVSMHYLQLNFSRDARDAEAAAVDGDPDAVAAAARAIAGPRGTNPDELRAGDGTAEVISGWFMNAGGEQVEALDAGERCTFCMHVKFHADVADPLFAFALRTPEGERVIATDTHREEREQSFAAGDEVIVYFGFENVLAPERYSVSAAVARSGSGAAWLDNRERFRTIVVSSTDPSGALIDPPFHVEIQRQVRAKAESA
ncbi:MAG TPA: ABC transporter ATP-binding protein [Baekduia sp.]|jgi:ABC-type polysaccharide/polyol phosphate transport system ATPase subunit